MSDDNHAFLKWFFKEGIFRFDRHHIEALSEEKVNRNKYSDGNKSVKKEARKKIFLKFHNRWKLFRKRIRMIMFSRQTIRTIRTF